MTRSIVINYGLIERYQWDDHSLKHPALGESFTFNFPLPGPEVARGKMRDTHLSIHEPLRKVS
jgi:hypothetical protein